jgi:tetratricopeptide (TPR) repeat protein
MKTEIIMPSKVCSLARVGASLVMLALGSHAAQAVNNPGLDADVLRVALAWEKIKFQVEDSNEQTKQMDALGEEVDAMAKQYPDRVEVLIWDGIITSERASLANEQGGVTGPIYALRLASRARDILERTEKLDPKVLDAGAPTSLGVLYYRVPSFPFGFGDKAKARRYLEEAIRNAPNGLDAYYFYGDFLYEQREYSKAADALKYALALPSHPERPIWDKNRRIVIKELLEKVQSKSEH